VAGVVLKLSRRSLLAAGAALPATQLFGLHGSAFAQQAQDTDLFIVRDSVAIASIVLSADAEQLEQAAASDLVKYVELMSGAKLDVITVHPSDKLPAGPAIVLGKAALRDEPTLQAALDGAAKKKPLTHADAIVLRRARNRLYLAGNNDRAHYFAASRLLQEWGCRWYMPTDFGECVPEQRTLSVGKVDYAYGSPFEIRTYWLSWLGDSTGQLDFQRRNFSSASPLPVFGHALGGYTKKLIPPGQSVFNIPLSEDATALEVTSQIEGQYAKGVPGISLAIEDGIYTSESQSDTDLQAGIYDKYMLAPSNTDSMLTLYNKVGSLLRARYPDSPTKIGGLAYANVTIPPQRILKAEPNIVMWLAPIDIDPNHGMDDLNSPPRQEYKAMMYRWSQVLDGRLAIYDYDQGQLVWRDLPNPSHHVFAVDVLHYRKAGILGVSTESRGATATTFLNLFFRLQLLWAPDADVDAMLAEFYPNFYGIAAAASMARYWNAIFAAWKATLVTEHEYMVAPAIYTPELIETLRAELRSAEWAVAPLVNKRELTRNEKLSLQRMQFTRASFDLIDNYLAMVRAAATDADYPLAVVAGEKALAAREKLTEANPTFTTYRRIGEKGPAWFPGEVEQMRRLSTLTQGPKGKLIARFPVEWAFRRDPNDTGLARGWTYERADLAFWEAAKHAATPENRKDYGNYWETLRTDRYAQAQGIRHPDGQSFTGYLWYQSELQLSAQQTGGNPRLMFPGLFNACWLYVNGQLVGSRPFPERWWLADYSFEWDADLAGHLRPGANLFALRCRNPHHFGGMFRRPFLYHAKVS
jgi:hypothetical protein